MTKPTADPNHVLLKIAHPDLYGRNPFNILNLPVNASGRDIRRRKEDVAAAFDAGTEALEFADILPNDGTRPPPTRGEVEEAFSALEDPERRIAFALFWFWPVPGSSKEKNPNRSIAQWLSSFDGDLDGQLKKESIPLPPLGRHNLAVFHHLKALGCERSLLADKEWNSATLDEVRRHWNSAIQLWNAVAADSETWHEMATLVSNLGDPRLDYHFARSIRDQFAFAFDQINVELAIAFAKQDRESDAKRQVEYMALSQPDADDVEGTFDDAFAGLLRQVEAVVKVARGETEMNPQEGFRQAEAILSQTDEPLRISRIIFSKGNSIRNAIAAVIFSGVRGCLVEYGNETRDWSRCLSLTTKLKAIAETEEQTRIVANDLKTILKNRHDQLEKTICWGCKVQVGGAEQKTPWFIDMYGPLSMGSSIGEVRFSRQRIPVCLCANCRNNPPNFAEYKPVQVLLDQGWHIGEGPSQDEIAGFWGYKKSRNQTPRFDSISSEGIGRGKGCLLPLLIFVGLLFVCGIARGNLKHTNLHGVYDSRMDSCVFETQFGISNTGFEEEKTMVHGEQ